MTVELALQDESGNLVSEFTTVFIDVKSKTSSPFSFICNKTCTLKGKLRLRNNKGIECNVTANDLMPNLNTYCVKSREVTCSGKRTDKRILWSEYLDNLSD